VKKELNEKLANLTNQTEIKLSITSNNTTFSHILCVRQKYGRLTLLLLADVPVASNIYMYSMRSFHGRIAGTASENVTIRATAVPGGRG
jgi:hypothetical protein